MTKLGYRQETTQAGAQVTVSSVGKGPNDNWTEVGRVKWDDLPGGWSTHTNATDPSPGPRSRIAFMVWARAGNFLPIGGTGARSRVQLCLGDQNGTLDQQYLAQCDFRAGELAATGSNSLSGFPLFWMIVLTDETSPNPSAEFLAKYHWTVDDDLVLYARIYEDRDTGVTGQFWVSDLVWLAFDLDAVGDVQTEWLYDRTTNAGPATWNNNIASEGSPAGTGWKYWHQQAPTQNGVGRQWLHFYYVHYAPAHNGNVRLPPRFAFGYEENGGPPFGGTFTPLVGTHRLGQCARGAGLQAGGNDVHAGGFAPHVQPHLVYQSAIRGYDLHNITGERTAVKVLKTFSIRIDRCAFLRTQVAQDVLPRGGVGRERVTSGFFNGSYFEPFEITVPRSADYTVLHQGIVQSRFPWSSQTFRHYSPTAFAEGTGRSMGPLSMLGPVIASDQEGVPGFEMVTESINGAPGTPAESRYHFHWWGKLGQTVPDDHWDVADLMTVGFFLEDNPANIPSFVPISPLPALLIPGREALGLGSLNAISFEPDAKSAVTLEVPLLGLRTDTGYERTWPKFSKVRREWKWTWQRLSRADRDTLEAFLIANPTFKYTEPDAAAATAFAVTGRPESIDEGFLYTVTCNVGELVFVGP